MHQFTLIQLICIWALPVLLSITLHEAAHAYVAFRCGDTTAKMFGRLTLNPIKHIDPIGTILIPILIGVLSHFSFIFGYAKPVPINPAQFRNIRRDTILVSLAGPVANLLMALIWAFLYKIATYIQPQDSMLAIFLHFTAQAGILINLVLAFLNLIPIPPLDGSRVVSSLLPAKSAKMYEKLEPYGFIILLLLLVTGVVATIITPLVNISVNILSSLLNI